MCEALFKIFISISLKCFEEIVKKKTVVEVVDLSCDVKNLKIFIEYDHVSAQTTDALTYKTEETLLPI